MPAGVRSTFAISQNRGTFAVLRVGQQAHILSRDLDWLFAGAGVLVAKGSHFRQIASAPVLTGGNIQAALAVVGDRQVHIQTLRARFEEFFQGLRRRRRVGFRNLEQQSIGKNSGSARNGKLPLGQQFRIDRQFAKSPGAELEGLEAEIKRILDEAILHLEVLRSQERALGPENWFQLLHRIAGGSPVTESVAQSPCRLSTRLPTITIPEPGSKGQIRPDQPAVLRAAQR